jgi:hypothetical protein
LLYPAFGDSCNALIFFYDFKFFSYRVPNDFFDSKQEPTQPKSILKNAPKSILKNATPQPAVVKSVVILGNYASSDEESDSEEEDAPSVPPSGADVASTTLPPGK